MKPTPTKPDKLKSTRQAKPEKSLGQIAYEASQETALNDELYPYEWNHLTDSEQADYHLIASAVAKVVRCEQPVVVFQGFIWASHLASHPGFLVIDRIRQHADQIPAAVIHRQGRCK